MSEMISVEEHQRLLALAVASAVEQVTVRFTTEMVTLKQQMQEALTQAKQRIAVLHTKLFGVQTESSQVVLTAEGQLFIDGMLGQAQSVAAAPAAAVPVEPPLKTVRCPRDNRGLAQRYPQLPLRECDAALPAELAEQVAAGALVARRSNRYQDSLVVPEGKPFLRREYEVELTKTGSTVPLMQIVTDRIVPGGDLADETIHQLVEGKILDAMPFHRQLTKLERVGVELPKQTVNDAVNAWGTVFAPLAMAIIAQVMASPVVHADASWQRLQAEGTCDRLHLWTLVGGGQVGYRLTEDLRHERASELIPADFKGRLVTDAWPGWLKLTLSERLSLCNAHARRPFADWLKRDRTNAHALRIIALYRELARLEHQADDGPPAQRLDRLRRIRAERSHAVMDDIHTEAERIVLAYPASHQLADGSRYILDYWAWLTRFLAHPEVPPDNNVAENALRINALIRKNSLFVGSLAAGHRDAIALTILQSCRLAKLVPAEYLAKVTPTMLLHRRGRPQNLDAITPRAVAAHRQVNKTE